jgi:hypothetical protein
MSWMAEMRRFSIRRRTSGLRWIAPYALTGLGKHIALLNLARLILSFQHM